MPASPALITRRHMLTLGASLPFAIALGGCDALGRALKPLVGQLLNVQFQSISQGNLNLGLALNVFNPNPIRLPELGLNMGLKLANRDIASVGTSSPFSLPEEGGADLSLNAGVNALNIITTLLSLRNQSDVPYAISGEARTPQLGGLSLPLNADGTVSLS